MIVPFNYLNYQFKDKKYFAEWSKLIDTSEFTLGPFIENLKKIFKICWRKALYFYK